jgi:hypothetical protein
VFYFARQIVVEHFDERMKMMVLEETEQQAVVIHAVDYDKEEYWEVAFDQSEDEFGKMTTIVRVAYVDIREVGIVTVDNMDFVYFGENDALVEDIGERDVVVVVQQLDMVVVRDGMESLAQMVVGDAMIPHEAQQVQ